jgi:hypothetical protein
MSQILNFVIETAHSERRDPSASKSPEWRGCGEVSTIEHEWDMTDVTGKMDDSGLFLLVFAHAQHG